MELIIKTKFNIGDAVYAVNYYSDYFYAPRKPYIITDIRIRIDNKGIHTIYECEQDGVTDTFPEIWVFNSRSECCQWCEAHNEVHNDY